MGRDGRSKFLLLETLKLLLLAGVFWALVDRKPWSTQESVARAAAFEKHPVVAPAVEETCWRSMLEDSTLELADAKAGLDEALQGIESRRDELSTLVSERARAIEGSLLGKLQAEQGRVAEAVLRAEANAERLEQLDATLRRDVAFMKRKMIYPTVQLRGSGTVGSGVIVYSEPQTRDHTKSEATYTTLILTAYHVVLEVLGDQVDTRLLKEVQVFADADAGRGTTLSAQLVLFDRGRDIALLRLLANRNFPNVARLMPSPALKKVDVFSRAYAVGCPLGNRPLPTIGEVSSRSKSVGGQVFWMLSAPTFFGNSGGGVYAAETGQLIGISSMIYTYGKTNPTVVPHMGLFVPLQSIYDWLETEGFDFVVRRQPVPLKSRWRLASGNANAEAEARPRPASTSQLKSEGSAAGSD